MPSDHCRATLGDWLRCSLESANDRLNWAIVSLAGLFSMTASQWTTTLALASGVLAVVLAVLQVVLTAIKIRKELR